MDDYYGNSHVRDRLVEYAGGFGGAGITSDFFSQCDADIFSEDSICHSRDLDWFLDAGKEIARSLSDSQSLLIHFDVEYVNFDSPILVFSDPERAFQIQQPVIVVIEELLLKWGITPLHLLTGQGHHFVWRVPHYSETESLLEKLAPAQEWIREAYERTACKIEFKNCGGSLRSFIGLGMVMEYLANEVKRLAEERTIVPVDTTAVISGPWKYGKPREIVSLDISEYGDPMHSRMIRMPFTKYMKTQRTWISGFFDDFYQHPDMFVIPLYEMNVQEALKIRHDKNAVMDLAKRASVRIPDESIGMDRLISEYLNSSLKKFHEEYYDQEQYPPEQWHLTYARSNFGSLPSCVRKILENPNDQLLKPAEIQMVVRSLLAESWHPRHIAGLIRSRLADPNAGWENAWDHYDPGIRAEFYTRLFAGQVADGIDRLIDYNCTSSQEKDLCNNNGENCSLASLCNKLNSKKHKYE
ncbi:MAG: hypothetical protein ACK56K_17075 [Akkermansiaceae bacterium]|jgi:hypothetical protein